MNKQILNPPTSLPLASQVSKTLAMTFWVTKSQNGQRKGELNTYLKKQAFRLEGKLPSWLMTCTLVCTCAQTGVVCYSAWAALISG